MIETGNPEYRVDQDDLSHFVTAFKNAASYQGLGMRLTVPVQWRYGRETLSGCFALTNTMNDIADISARNAAQMQTNVFLGKDDQEQLSTKLKNAIEAAVNAGATTSFAVHKTRHDKHPACPTIVVTPAARTPLL